MKHATKPIAITPLILSTLPVQREGLTPFTYSRFLVPWLCNYEGWAIFLDTDILARGDIHELMRFASEDHAVSVSKNPLRFEWSSVMLFQCARCKILTPDYVKESSTLHKLEWAEGVGDLPPEWNHLVGYDAPKPAKLIHFTQGIPGFPETKDSEYGDDWRKDAVEAMTATTWQELMGNSVHAAPVNKRLTSTT
jgi:hypothetical protein